MFHLILTGVTFLLITHSATAISQTCETAQGHVDTVWHLMMSAAPQMQHVAANYFATLNFDITNPNEVRHVVCTVTEATSQKQLAQDFQLSFGQFKTIYAHGQRMLEQIGGIEGLEKTVITGSTVLRALADGGYPQWPLTTTYDEWLAALNQLIDEVGPDFMKYLKPAFAYNFDQSLSTPTIDDPTQLARQLTDATSLEDFCTRMNLNYREVSAIFTPFDIAIQHGKVDEIIALAHAVILACCGLWSTICNQIGTGPSS